MATRLAILGLDGHQREWLDAVVALRDAGDIEVVGVAHRSMAAARDTAEVFKTLGVGKPVATFDDPRILLEEKSPQVLLMDRPPNTSMDYLLGCVESGIGIFSLGPPVDSLAEAQALAEALGPRSRRLYIFPHFAGALQRCARAEEFIRPIRFAGASWLGTNHALLRGREPAALHELPVRSLSVLAWDALTTLIQLIDVPTAVYTAIRGTAGIGNSFADLSGAASITLRFADDAAAALSVCDRIPAGAQAGRQLLLWGTSGMLRLDDAGYSYYGPDGKLVDREDSRGTASPAAEAADALRGFLAESGLPESPHAGWELRLEDVAAVMEAVVVSHRTGQPESPDRFRRLRR